MESLLKMLFIIGTEGLGISSKSVLIALVGNHATKESADGNSGGIEDFS